MTKAKRVEKLKHFITCLKCEVSGKCCDNNCPTQYNAGNMGEIIENLEEIAKALEQEPILDKIRAEIKALTSNRGFLSCSVDHIHEEIDAVFDKYKAESEG